MRKRRNLTDDRKKKVLREVEAEATNHHEKRNGTVLLREFAKLVHRELPTIYWWKKTNKFPGLFKYVGTHWEADVDFWLKHHVHDAPPPPDER